MDKEELIIVSSTGILLLIVAILFSLLMRSMTDREDVLLKYEAEQALADYLFRMQTGSQRQEDIEGGTYEVEGLGIYTQEGVLIVGAGSVPDTFSFSSYALSEGSYADYDRKSGQIEYIRRARISFTATRFNESILPEVFGEVSVPVAEYLYIAFDGSDYRNKLILNRIVNILIILMLIGIYSILLNIFKRNREYRRTLERQESLVRMGEAARTLAHEIKNPLSALRIQTALLKKTLPEEHHEGLYVIESELHRLASLSDRVGEFLKNPIGDPVPIDCRELIEQITGTFDLSIPIHSSGQDRPIVLFDHQRARSVFENLIKNAVESSQDDPEVEIQILTTSSAVTIRVLDRGSGLPEGKTEQLFDPFFTTKISGSGIGLAITRRFITAAGGSITLSAREGGGSVAQIILERRER